MIPFSIGLCVGVLSVPLGVLLLGISLSLLRRHRSGEITASRLLWFLDPGVRWRRVWQHHGRVSGKNLGRDALWTSFSETVNGSLLHHRRVARGGFARLPLCLSPFAWKGALRRLLDLPFEEEKAPLDPDRAAWVERLRLCFRPSSILHFPSDPPSGDAA